jgi:hypothetical protein
MQDLARVSLSLGLLFLASVIVSYGLMLLARSLRRTPSPIPNGQIKVTSGASAYRARFLCESREGWLFTAPLQRDAYVPLRVGEPLIIEAPSVRGVLRFRTEIVDRRADSGVMVAQRPKQVHLEDRRAEERRTDLSTGDARVEGKAAELIDLSRHGAKLSVEGLIPRGDRVRLELPWLNEPCFGWTLESERSGDATMIRVRFEETLELPTPKRGAAPAV